jgi:hypothetical protein
MVNRIMTCDKVMNLSIQVEFLQAVCFDHLVLVEFRSGCTRRRRGDIIPGNLQGWLPEQSARRLHCAARH